MNIVIFILCRPAKTNYHVTGEKMQIIFLPNRGSNLVCWTHKSYTLPSHYKSRLVPQGSTSVLYIYTPWHFSPSKMNFVPDLIGVQESWKEFYAHSCVIYGGHQM